MPVMRKPPRRDYWNFDGELLQQLADQYGLEQVAGFRPILLDGEWRTLIDVRSETSRKMTVEVQGGRRLFLKEIPWYVDAGALDFAIGWQDQARAAGLPVPAILRTRRGRAWVRIGGSMFTLTEHVAGHRYTGSASERRATAALLGRLHLAPVLLPNEPTEDPFDGMRDHVALTRETAGDELPSGRAGLGFLDEMNGDVEAWRQAAAATGWASLVGQAAHGDVNPWNLLYQEGTGEVVALFDWDNAHRAPWSRDVAELLLSFAAMRYRQDSTNFAAEPPGFEVDTALELLAAYEAVRPLSDVERRCLPPLVGGLAVELACLGLMRHDYAWHQGRELAEWARGCADATASLLAKADRR